MKPNDPLLERLPVAYKPTLGWRLSRLVGLLTLIIVSFATLSCASQTETASVPTQQIKTPVTISGSSSTSVATGSVNESPGVNPTHVENDSEDESTPVVPDIPMFRFVITTTHQTTPQDVILELTFVAGGGDEGPNLCLAHEHPTVFLAPADRLGAWDVATVKTCGWQYREKVAIVLTKPNGTEITESALASDDEWAVELNYRVNLDDPPGQYKVSFSGEQREIESDFIVGQSSSPTITYDGKSTMFLDNFVPNERLRIFAYLPKASTAPLAAWQEYFADTNGRLFVSFDANVFAVDSFVVIGDISGEVRPRIEVWPYKESSIRTR